jgi:DNA polymerase I-like protein with 3'-5' exonuclease and polymerase domains
MLPLLHLDFEYGTDEATGLPIPICMSARTDEWEQCFELLVDPPKSWPIPIENYIVTGWHAWAESQCIEALGWERPPFWIDPAAEFMVATNRPKRPSRALYKAMRHIGIDPPHSDEYKSAMQGLAQNHTELTDRDVQKLMAYCSSDTWCSLQLWNWIVKHPFEREDVNANRLLHALIRGKYSEIMGRAMFHGMPIDFEKADYIRENKPDLISHVTRQAADAYPEIFEGESFNALGFTNYLERLGVLDGWPSTPKGKLKTDKETLRRYADRFPQFRLLAELQGLRGVLSRYDLEFYGNRARTLPSLFWTVTGRGNPTNTKFLWSLPRVFRGLAQAEPGMKLVVADYKSAEIMVAACLMQDPKMIAAYLEDDFYIAFGLLTGMTSEEAREARHMLKQAVLGNSFGQSAHGLAKVLGCDQGKADWLLHLLRSAFRQWHLRTRAHLDRVRAGEPIYTPLGWRLDLGQVGKRRGGRYDSSENQAINYRVQSAAQDLLRWAVVKLDQAGLTIVATNHDSIVCYMPEDDDHSSVAELMAEAGEDLFGHRFRVDVEVYKHGDTTTPKGKEHLLQMLTDPTPF